MLTRSSAVLTLFLCSDTTATWPTASQAVPAIGVTIIFEIDHPTRVRTAGTIGTC